MGFSGVIFCLRKRNTLNEVFMTTHEEISQVCLEGQISALGLQCPNTNQLIVLQSRTCRNHNHDKKCTLHHDDVQILVSMCLQPSLHTSVTSPSRPSTTRPTRRETTSWRLSTQAAPTPAPCPQPTNRSFSTRSVQRLWWKYPTSERRRDTFSYTVS